MLAEGQKKAAEEKLREAEQERVGETERRPAGKRYPPGESLTHTWMSQEVSKWLVSGV